MKIEAHYRQHDNKYEKIISCKSENEAREIFQYLVDFFDEAAAETSRILTNKSNEPLPAIAVQRNPAVSIKSQVQACFNLVETKSGQALPVRLQLFLDWQEYEVIIFVDVAHHLFDSYNSLMQEFISKISVSLPKIIALKA